MALNKQIHMYSVDTACFYNNAEKEIHNKMQPLHIRKNLLKKKKNLTEEEVYELKEIGSRLKDYKVELKETFTKNVGIRILDEEMMKKSKVVSVFESTLTRTMGIKENTLNLDLFIIQAFYFNILEDIIKNGFIFNNEKYVCFTASAGQIRTKKTVFIREEVLKEHERSLMCGISRQDINDKGGVNINKFLAYLALCNSATDLWETFDINKTIVVEDMETLVNGKVDFIDDLTYEVERKIMDVPISHTDGVGMVLPKLSLKNFMLRMPWVKGLLVSFPFDVFINEKCNGNCKVKDIYGKEYDIIKDDIQIIFTKSQFKMYKYYSSWQEYIDKFIQYKCQAGKCNEEEDNFSYAKINYQMLQTLSDMTDEEINKIAKRSIQNIKNIGNDRLTMLRVLGVTASNVNKNYLQKAIERYPELLRDIYSKEVLKDVKRSLVKSGRSGKLDINGKYTFISPDLYAFCEWLFLGIKDPIGLLKDGECYCNLFKDNKELDLLRSPHLYLEHAVRNNIINENNSKWFTTNAVYISCHDLISKILQADFDGDKSLVCADKTLLEAAKRNIIGIVPLFYNMKKANALEINSSNIYNGLNAAYTGGNIGEISNNITKIWNSENINLEVVKILCLLNNFVID